MLSVAPYPSVPDSNNPQGAHMSQPVIANNKPAKVTLKEGEEYAFCRCGRSKDQPFCDGSHAGTDFSPKIFTAEKNGDAFLCQCKHTEDAPFCDGTHKQFSDDQVGEEGPGKDEHDDTNKAPAPKATTEEPTVEAIHLLAREGLKGGGHGPMVAM